MDSSWALAIANSLQPYRIWMPGRETFREPHAYSLKEYKVYQTIKRGAIDLTPGFIADTNHVALNDSVTFTNNTTGGYVGTPETFHWIFPGASPDTSDLENPTVAYTDCGSHDVTLIVNKGGQIDTLTRSLYITVGPLVNIVVTPQDTACYYVHITLDATTPGATSYLWTPGGFTTPSITVDEPTIGLGLHTYSVAVSDTQCTNTQTKTIFYEACTGIAQNNTDLSTIIYPNPNQGNFKIELNSLIPQNISIVITNSLGIQVYSENDITFNGKLLKTIDLNNVPSGVYFISILNAGKSVVQKFLVN